MSRLACDLIIWYHNETIAGREPDLSGDDLPLDEPDEIDRMLEEIA